MDVWQKIFKKNSGLSTQQCNAARQVFGINNPDVQKHCGPKLDKAAIAEQIYKRLGPARETLAQLQNTAGALHEKLLEFDERVSVLESIELERKFFTSRFQTAMDLMADTSEFAYKTDTPPRAEESGNWTDNFSKINNPVYGSAKNQHWKHGLISGWHKRLDIE